MQSSSHVSAGVMREVHRSVLHELIDATVRTGIEIACNDASRWEAIGMRCMSHSIHFVTQDSQLETHIASAVVHWPLRKPHLGQFDIASLGVEEDVRIGDGQSEMLGRAGLSGGDLLSILQCAD